VSIWVGFAVRVSVGEMVFVNEEVRDIPGVKE
jgi:hypothetical protein